MFFASGCEHIRQHGGVGVRICRMFDTIDPILFDESRYLRKTRIGGLGIAVSAHFHASNDGVSIAAENSRDEIHLYASSSCGCNSLGCCFKRDL